MPSKIAPGTRLGPYEIQSLLGAGGMGEVYRARDTRLGRDVAIKVLPHSLISSPDDRARLKREAKAISALNHPHICVLHDIGQEGETDYLVMELVEGETLAQRIARGALPIGDVLRIGTHIADALDRAHRAGVVHRDLKPGNVMLPKSGAKLMDFGLARSAQPGKHGADDMTLTARGQAPRSEESITAMGTVAGTYQYMAPEQLEGKRADARSDIFSAGVVIYEMTTGQRPFEGSSSAAVMAAILKTDPPPMSRIRSDVPRALDRLVQQCLAKNVDERWQSAHDVGLELRSIQEFMALPEAGAARGPSRHRTHLGWIAGVIGIVALATALLLTRALRAPSPREVIRFSLDLPPGTTIDEPFWSHPAISPDGRVVAFVATSGGERGLWIRPLDALSARLLVGTEGALAPFWSPDSRSIAFFAQGKLKAVALDGGTPHSICNVAAVSATGSWGASGTIVFHVAEAAGPEGLYRVSASGGTPSPIRPRDASGEEFMETLFPDFLPDGRFLFVALTTKGEGGGYLASLDHERVELITGHTRLASRVEYAPPGYVLGVAENTLLAHRFNLRSGRLEGSPVPIAENVAEFSAGARFSVSNNGVLVYGSGWNVKSRLTWFDRAGHILGSVGAVGMHENVNLSPDERRLAVAIVDEGTGGSDIWVFNLPEDTPTRMTSEAMNAQFDPIWSPDGREIAYSQPVNAPPNLFRMRLRDPEAELLVASNGHAQWACDWSPDGGSIVYIDRDPNTWNDLWLLPLDEDRKPQPWLQTPFSEIDAQFSPDGRWLAYASNETGRYEVYVRPLRGTGEKRRVSSTGGRIPRWRADGKEIFYVDLGAEPTLVSASVDPSTVEPTSTPRPLFPVSGYVQDYDVTKDGQRFLINYDADLVGRTLVHVVVNWPSGIQLQSQRGGPTRR